MGAGYFEKCLENNLFPNPQTPQTLTVPFCNEKFIEPSRYGAT